MSVIRRPSPSGVVDNVLRENDVEILSRPGEAIRAIEEEFRYATRELQVESGNFEEELGPDLDELFALRSAVDEWRRKVGAVLEAVEFLILDALPDDGKVRVGPTLFKRERPASFKIREGYESKFWKAVEDAVELSIDPAELVDGLRQSFNLNQIRKGGLQVLDEMLVPVLADPATGEVGESLFGMFERVESGKAEPKLVAVPVEKAGKFAALLPDGEVRVGRGAGVPVEEVKSC